MRYVQIYGEGAIYDLYDGSLEMGPIGEWCGRKIHSAEALLVRIEELCGDGLSIDISPVEKIDQRVKE